MKIFLAGASGVIGRSLVPRLTGAGHEVTGMTGDAATTGLVRSFGARPVMVDVFDRDRLAEVIRAAHPNAVIDQLTSLRHGDYLATNRLRTQGTRDLVDAAIAAGVQTVVAQSYCIYAPGPGLADETDPLDVNSPAFGAAAEALVALEAVVSEAPRGVLLRYGTLYGPGTGYASDGAIAAQVGRRAACHRGCDVVPACGGRRRRRGPGTGIAGCPVNIVDDEPAPGTDWLPVYAAAIGAGVPPERPGTGSGLRGAANSKAPKDYNGNGSIPAGVKDSGPRSDKPRRRVAGRPRNMPRHAVVTQTSRRPHEQGPATRTGRDAAQSAATVRTGAGRTDAGGLRRADGGVPDSGRGAADADPGGRRPALLVEPEGEASPGQSCIFMAAATCSARPKPCCR